MVTHDTFSSTITISPVSTCMILKSPMHPRMVGSASLYIVECSAKALRNELMTVWSVKSDSSQGSSKCGCCSFGGGTSTNSMPLYGLYLFVSQLERVLLGSCHLPSTIVVAAESIERRQGAMQVCDGHDERRPPHGKGFKWSIDVRHRRWVYMILSSPWLL